MVFARYAARLRDSLFSRRDLAVEELHITESAGEWPLVIDGRLRFWDGSLLEFTEAFVQRRVKLVKVRYSYHYQDASDRLVFRYDNVPHYPQISTYPHHKHVVGPTAGGDTVEPAETPDLTDVLREIDRYLQA